MSGIRPNEGGPAFPVECSFIKNERDETIRGVQTGNYSGWETGMSLRQWYAGLRMQGISANAAFACWTRDQITKDAFEQADAMIREGSK